MEHPFCGVFGVELFKRLMKRSMYLGFIEIVEKRSDIDALAVKDGLKKNRNVYAGLGNKK